MGQKVCIRLMGEGDGSNLGLRNSLRGDDAATVENEKIAYSILASPPAEQKVRLQNHLVQLTPQQKDSFLAVYNQCKQVDSIRKRFDRAIEEADDPHYREYWTRNE